MKIAVDARFLTHPQVGGFKTYTENLVRAIAEVDSTNEYLLYVDRAADAGCLPAVPNFTYRVVQASVPGFSMPAREQVALPRAISHDRPDLVHFLCNTAPANTSVPFVLTLHDTIQVTSSNPFRLTGRLSAQKVWAITAYSKWAILRSVRSAATIITVSTFEKGQIAAELGISPDKIAVTHLAPNMVYRVASADEAAQWRSTLAHDLSLPARFVLGIGFEPRKNIPLLIEAFAQVAADDPELNLVIVAAQEQRQRDFQQLAAQHQLENRVLILGRQRPDQLVQLYNLATLFAYPSERESFGLPPLEAMACGTPTIAMQRSSIPEVVGDGALLVDSDDPAAWAAVIRQTLGDQAALARLTSLGLKRAAAMTWQHCARNTVAVYQSVYEQSLHPAAMKPRPA